MSTCISQLPPYPDDVRRLGQAIHAFSYLEWAVIWTITKLSANGREEIPKGTSSPEIARAFSRTIVATSPPLPDALHSKLRHLDEQYRVAVGLQGNLLATCASGRRGGTVDVRAAEIEDAVQFFEQAACYAFELLHGELQRTRS